MAHSDSESELFDDVEEEIDEEPEAEIEEEPLEAAEEATEEGDEVCSCLTLLLLPCRLNPLVSATSPL